MSKEEMKKLYGQIIKQYGPAMVSECKKERTETMSLEEMYKEFEENGTRYVVENGNAERAE